MHVVLAGSTESNGHVTYSVSIGEVAKCRTEVARQKAALRAALDAFLEHVNAKIAAAHLDGTTMEAALFTLICRSILAIDDVTAVFAGIDKLREMEMDLDILESGDTTPFAP